MFSPRERERETLCYRGGEKKRREQSRDKKKEIQTVPETYRTIHKQVTPIKDIYIATCRHVYVDMHVYMHVYLCRGEYWMFVLLYGEEALEEEESEEKF